MPATVITTTAQAETFLKHLGACEKSAKRNLYSSELKRPVKWMECTCCGGYYYGRQWWGQDTGYGLGDCCVKFCHVDPNGGENQSYGVPGIHFLIGQIDPPTHPAITAATPAIENTAIEAVYKSDLNWKETRNLAYDALCAVVSAMSNEDLAWNDWYTRGCFDEGLRQYHRGLLAIAGRIANTAQEIAGQPPQETT